MNSDLSFGQLFIRCFARTLGRPIPSAVGRGGPVWRRHHRLRDRLAGEEANEFGLIAHGPDSSKLIRLVNDLLHRWSHERSNNPSSPLTSQTTFDDRLAAGGRVRRPETFPTIGW
jgi:protein-L-isoaspartate(D-aspartate) O-methyltransferase